MHMRIRILPIALLLCLLAATPASAKYRVGIGEQNAKVFDDPAWQSLGLKRVRYLVPWDYAKHRGPARPRSASSWAARTSSKQDVLVTFTAQRGCYVNGKYAKKKACRAPSVEDLHEGRQGVRQDLPVGQDLLGLERDQPQVPADLQVPEARGAVLQRAGQGREEGQVPRDGRRPARHAATSPATCASSSAPSRARRSCGACTTTATSTTGAARTRACCCGRCAARCG